MNPDHELVVLLSHRHADPPVTQRRRRRVQGVVDEVAEQRDQVLAVDGAAGHDGVVADAKLNSSLRRHGGLREEERAEHRITDPFQQRFRQLLMQPGGLSDELHRVVASAHLHESRDRVQAIREFVSLRAQRFGQALDPHSA